jgi:hypothetical protein
MASLHTRCYLTISICAGILSVVALPGTADEIRLRDGKKLYGAIVAYEDNMFKVKTDYGYVLVEKDKIESIIPSTPAPPKAESQPTAKKQRAPAPRKPAADHQAALESAVAPASKTPPKDAILKEASPSAAAKREKTAPQLSSAAVKPESPAKTPQTNAVAPALKAEAAAPATTLAAATAPPPPPREAAIPANREEIQGNLYTNYTHGFRMYKAPSWSLNEDARKALPNAIVAMGTSNESTLMVVGQEKTKESLDSAATTVEKRLHEAYENYRRNSQRKTVIGGLPAMEYHYRGKADDHDWSGTLVVVARGDDILTVLGMTYADTDLIQIQENVIARSIASFDFSVH